MKVRRTRSRKHPGSFITRSKMKKKSRGYKKVFLDYLVLVPRIIFAVFIFVIVFVSPLIFISGSESFFRNNLNEECFIMISEKDCRDLQANAFEYLNDGKSLDDRYNVQEQSHFSDVKKILEFGRQLVSVLFVFTMIYFIIMYFFDRKEIFKTLRIGGIVSLSFIGLLLLFTVLSFWSTFFLFHAVLFPHGNWMFPFDSTIIVVFSEEFFVHAAFVSFFISLGVGILILGICRLKSFRK